MTVQQFLDGLDHLVQRKDEEGILAFADEHLDDEMFAAFSDEQLGIVEGVLESAEMSVGMQEHATQLKKAA